MATVADATGAGFADALAALTLIEGEYEGIGILAALPNEDYDTGGNLIDTVHVTYRIIGRPGTFNVSVPYAVNWQAIAFFQVSMQARTIELIYEGAPDNVNPPTVLLTTPPPEPTLDNTYYEWQTINGVRTIVPVVGQPIPTPGSPVFQ